MAARVSMAALILRTRKLAGDNFADGNPQQQFTDQDVQDQLDHNLAIFKYSFLRPFPDIQGSGILLYNEYRATVGDWEDSVVLTDRVFAVLTPSSSDLIKGIWRFDTTPSPGQQPPVRISGSSYDCFRSAADLCDMWASMVATAVDFSTTTTKVSLSQQRTALESRAKQLKMQARARSILLSRSDEASSASYGFTNWLDNPFNS